MNNEFYGRGISYPLRRSAGGGIQPSAGIHKVEESIRLILGTGHGERVMRPRFGSNLKSLAFAPNNQATANLARYYVEDALNRWEPRIELLGVTVDYESSPNALLIEIRYRLRGASELGSLTYLFDLEQPA